MNICLIPARIGSKRIKKKNIKKFYGKPLISYAIHNAKKSKLFKKIIVSTDSKKIAKIAIKYGAEVPFLRPKKLSNDKATDIEVRKHFINFCKKEKISLKYLCYLYPATPLLKITTLKKSLKFFKKNRCFELMVISKHRSPIAKSFIKGKNNEVKQINNLKKFKTNIFYDAGQFYWYNFNSNNNKKCGFEINPIEAIDINTINDFNYAKKLYLLKNKK